MNTHDIELPPLPPAYPTYEFPDGGYDADEMRAYARAAIEPYAKRIAQLEAVRFAYASEFPPNEDGDPDVGRIHENIRKLKADRKRRGEPVAWGAFYFGGKRHGKLYSHTETEAQIDAYIADVHRSNDSITLRKGPLYTAPQPAESCASLISDKTACGSENGECDSQPAKPVKSDTAPFASDRADWETMQDTDGSTEYAVHHQRPPAEPVKVPPEKTDPWYEEGSTEVFDHAQRQAYVDGWNACRKAFLKETNDKS